MPALAVFLLVCASLLLLVALVSGVRVPSGTLPVTHRWQLPFAGLLLLSSLLLLAMLWPTGDPLDAVRAAESLLGAVPFAAPLAIVLLLLVACPAGIFCYSLFWLLRRPRSRRAPRGHLNLP